MQVKNQRLFVVAGAFWVAQKLHSVVTDDGLHSTCQQSPGCKARPTAQPVLPSSSLHHCGTQQDEMGEANKLLLHLGKPFCISTHLPFVFSIQSTTYLNKRKEICVDSWEKRSLWVRRAGGLDVVSQDHYLLKGCHLGDQNVRV